MYAVKTQRHDLIGLLIRHGADVNNQDSKGRSNVHLALDVTFSGYYDDFFKCFELLREANTNPDFMNDIGQTPLWLAASTDGMTHIMTLLLNTRLCDVTKADFGEKRTPLQAAITHTHKDRKTYVKLLLSAGSDVNHRDGMQMTSLMNVMWRSWTDGHHVTSEDYGLCEDILRQPGCDVNSTCPSGNRRRNWGNALCMAADRGATSLVDLFLFNGASPDVTDGDGDPCLIIMCHNNKINMAARLIRANVTMDAHEYLPLVTSHLCISRSPFQICITNGFLDLALLLVECGYDLKMEDCLRTNRNVPENLLRNMEVWYSLRDCICNPTSLVDLSRLAFRQKLKPGIFLKVVNNMNIAGLIRKLLLFEDRLVHWL